MTGPTWLRAGVLAAGLGAALLAGPGTASADDGAERGTAGRESDSSSHQQATPRRGAATPAAKPGHPGARRSASVTSAAVAAESAGAVSVDAESFGTKLVGAELLPMPESAPGRSGVAPATTAVSSPASHAEAAAATDLGPIQSAVLAAQSYVYGYPLMEYQRIRQTVGTVNTLHSLTSFANPDIDPMWIAIGGGKRPNVDTFYSLAELDLSKGPIVLSVPDMGNRYFSFQLTDPYTNVSDYIGSRTTGYGPGRYAITWAGGPQAEIPGAQTVVVPYSNMLMLGRTLAGDAADQQQAINLISQYSLTPGGGLVSPVIDIPEPGIGYLDSISAAMELNPPPAADGPQLAQMARIGVGPGLRVADAHLGWMSSIGVDLGVRAAAALLPLLTTLNQYAVAFGNRGWATPDPAIGNFGTNYLLRAGVAEAGLLANTPAEAVYSAGLLDSHRLPLSGSYTMHFAPGQEPPVGAFWSVTVYDSAGYLVANSQHRYDVSSSRPDELVRRPDGSIDIIFAPSDPGDPGANWLAVPTGGGFSAYLRMYEPGQPVLDGSWVAPEIVRRC